MPNKTLSVRDDDLPLWERADRAAKSERTTVSALVATALAEKLGGADTCRVGMYERSTAIRIEVFEGRWLTDAPNDVEGWDRPLDSSRFDDYWQTFVAETKRGRIAVYSRFCFSSYEQPPLFEVFDDLDAARKALAGDERVDQGALTKAGCRLGRNGKRGQEIRWRDI